MDARNILRLLFVLGLICTALAKDRGCQCNYQQCICPESAKDDGCECSAAEIAVLGASGAVITVVGAPLAVAAAGFTSAGISAGSLASWLMSTTAVASGGGVGATSFVAFLQSVGAAGFTAAGNACLAATGASLAAACSKIKCKFKAPSN